MRWEVRGADASTGGDRMMVIEGLSAEAVEAKARYAGMLVSSIAPVAAAPVVAYALPDRQKAVDTSANPTIAAAAAGIPTYASIRRGAKILGVLGMLLIGFGLLMTGVGVWKGIDFFCRGSSQISGIEEVAGALIAGIVLLTGGVAARLFAAVALTVRDVARRRGGEPASECIDRTASST